MSTSTRPRDSRIVYGVLAALLLVGTAVWRSGHEAQGLPTADLHADASYYYVYLPALLRGDLDFTREYQETHNWYRLGTTPTGRPSNVFGIGPAVVSAPLFLVGHALARVTGARADGFSRWETWLYTWSSLPWSLAAVAVAYQLVRRRLGGGQLAIAGPVLAALAGPVAYYAARQPGYAHPMATFFATLLVERWDASYDAGDHPPRPRSLRTWLVLGAVLGAAALVRPQLGLWGVLLVHTIVDDARRSLQPAAFGQPHLARWRLVGRWLVAGAATLLVFSPQLLAWKVLYGRWWIVPQGAHFMRWDDPCWSEVLFSSRNGLFPWSPAYLLFAFALLIRARRRPRLVGGLVVGSLLQTIANGAVWDWWGGGSFGGRRFDSTYVAFAVGASLLVVWSEQAITPAVGQRATPGARAFAGAAAIGMLLVLQLVVVNLHLIRSYVVTSARIGGGEAAARVMHRRVPAVLAWPATLLSSMSNLPVRALFAFRHHASLKDYDKVVGVHVLGETYPGLNGPADERLATIDVHDRWSPLLRGFEPALGDSATILDGHARVLVVLNRDDRIQLTTTLEGSGPATILWNGREVLRENVGIRSILQFVTDDVRRETNELTFAVPPGTTVRSIEVAALSSTESRALNEVGP